MFHRPPKKYSEYLVNIEQSIDWILKTLWKLKKGEFAQNLQEVTDEGNTTTNTIDVAGITTDYVQLDTAATPTLQPGMFAWNNADGTANLRLKGNNVTLQVGQETVAHVVNKTGADLLESQYKVVRVRIASEGGSQGQRLAVVLAQGNNDPDSATTLGIVTENIANNQEGFITVFGNVNGINTTGSLQGETWVDGDVLYLSPTTAGSLTKVKPVAPQHTVIVGYVLYAHGVNGKIFVKVDNGYELDELHNVKITSVANSDLLQYDSTLQVWKNVAASVAVPTPTLAQVTTAGNTTTNAITVGLLNSTALRAVVTITDTTGGVNNPSYFGSYDNFLQLAVNRNPSTGVFAQTGKASSQISLEGDVSTSSIRFYTTTANNTVPSERLRIFANGNVGINTTTDAGYKLDVNGTVRLGSDTLVKGSNTASNVVGFEVQNSAATSAFQIFNDGQARFYNTVRFYNSLILNDIIARNVGITLDTNGIRSTNFIGSVTASGAIARGSYFNNTLVAAANNDVLVGLDINPTFTNGAFTGVSNYALRVQGKTVFGSTTQGQPSDHYFEAVSANPTMVVRSVTVSAGADIQQWWSNNNKYAYLNSSGDFYPGRIRVSGTGPSYPGISFSSDSTAGIGYTTGITIITNNTERLRVFNTTGNVGIGTTTDSGQKLQISGSIFIKGTTSLTATKIFEVQNGSGTSIMDFRDNQYAFFGCGQGGGSASGFIFNYSNTSYTQFSGYNYGAGSGSYKPILMDTDTGGRNQGIFVNFGVSTNTPPNSDTEFGVLGRTSDSTTYISRFRNSGNTDKFAIRADGALFTNTLQGYSGTLNIPTNPPGSTNITITNGIITNIA